MVAASSKTFSRSFSALSYFSLRLSKNNEKRFDYLSYYFLAVVVVGGHSFKLRFELELGEGEDSFVFFFLLLGLVAGLLMVLSLDYVRVNAVGEDKAYSFS